MPAAAGARRLAGLGALLWAGGGGLLLPAPALAQHADHASPMAVHAGASATLLLTHASPGVGGVSRTEGYITRPLLSAGALLPGGRVELRGMLNLEGVTLERGELNAGIWGEGYVDRRHPHTYLHELVATFRADVAGVSASLTAGRGFVPFGTDDPMTRPFNRFPANHHLAQILERWIGVAAVRAGPMTVEAALFNGDEPVGPDGFGRAERFADSWAARATLRPTAGWELQGSHARVESPEHALGGGLDQRKWSASARWERNRPDSGGEYLLGEWARTEDYSGPQLAFAFHSALAEGSISRRGWRGALRFERTERPEEERLANRFRSARPHGDENILGITRWTAISVRAERAVRIGPVRGVPFLEATRLNVKETTGSIFVPEEFYGTDDLWSASLGVSFALGTTHERMGRYGVAKVEE